MKKHEIKVGEHLGIPPDICEVCGRPFANDGENGRRRSVYYDGKWQCDRTDCLPKEPLTDSLHPEGL